MASKKGVTCLHLAAAAGKLEIVRYLVEDANPKLSVNLRTTASKSLPIHVAAKGGQLEVLQYFVEDKSQDPITEDKNFEDCLTLAIKAKQPQVGVYLVGLNCFD